MLASITRLQPRPGSFDEALVAYRAARLHECLSLLRGVQTVQAIALRVRALLRLGDVGGAREKLAGLAPVAERDKSEIALLQAVTYSRLGDRDEAETAFHDAFVHSVAASDPALEAEIEFYRGLTAFGDEDLVEARSNCERGLNAAASAPTMDRRSVGTIPIEHVVSRTHELLALIDAGEGRYQESIKRARLALETLDSCSTVDSYQEAFALKNLSILARDFDIEADANLLLARVPQFTWSRDLCFVEFTTLEALGWCSALRGASVEALRLFRKAANVASSDPERILVGVDRALLAREFGYRPMVVDEIESALDLADACDWENSAGDYRTALLTLAQASAPIVPSRARRSLDRYTAIRNSIDSTFAARIEPRARAEEAYTHGLVLRAEGRLTASAERLTAAFETWESIGYSWRAGRAALELTELDAGDVFRLAVRRELHRRPNSVFSTRARLVA